MKSQKNIGAGQTEIVLSTIFWLLTKLVNDKDCTGSKVFKNKYAQSAIEDALEILLRN